MQVCPFASTRWVICFGTRLGMQRISDREVKQDPTLPVRIVLVTKVQYARVHHRGISLLQGTSTIFARRQQLLLLLIV
jgi:hypothetical protein